MSLSAKEIGDVVAALQDEMKGARTRKVISPEAPDRIVLELRRPGENQYLQVVTASGACRLGRIPSKPTAAAEPHPFVMLLRGELAGLIVREISQIGGDRAVRIDFEGRERQGTLIAELTSRHANLFWLDDSGRIAGSFYPNRSHKRPLVPGERYVPPLPHPRPQGEPARRFTEGPDLEQRIEEHYRQREEERVLELDRSRTRRLASKGARHLDRLLGKLEKDRKRARAGEEQGALGHLLKANLYRAKKGMTRLEVTDFEGKPAVVPLDPKLTPVENMQRLFDRAKRLGKAGPRIEQRTAATEKDRLWIEELLEEIGSAGPERLAAIRQEIRRRFPQLRDTSPGRRRSAPAERLPYREIGVSAGRTARVGRSARDNDALTLRHARPDDLWLHVRGRTGSHVVVPLGRGEDPTPELLVDAAHLAAHFSEAKDDADVEVIYTRRRYVQKPKGAAPGSVRVLREKTIRLRVEPDRLGRLLGR